MAVPANWDFQTADWALDPLVYVSAPSSLRCCNIKPWWRALAKNANLKNIEQGRLISSIRSQYFANTPPCFFFRHQAAPGGVTPHTHYAIRFHNNEAALFRLIDGIESAVWYTPLGITMAPDTWYRYRLTWWNAYNFRNVLSTAVQLERWTGTTWYDTGTFYDPYNLGYGSATNRVGVGSFWGGPPIKYVHHDDTEIWVPTP